MKVPHSTRTAILQLIDPAYAAAQEHVETRIWNFHFLSFLSGKLLLNATSILGVRVVKVSHANAILQLVDPAYAATQEHAKT